MEEDLQTRRSSRLVFLSGAIFGALIVLAVLGLVRIMETEDVVDARVVSTEEGIDCMELISQLLAQQTQMASIAFTAAPQRKISPHPQLPYQ